MSLPSDTPQGVANALGYLQHHLQELMERQHVSKSNINSTLATLTVQLQQLTQLVANPFSLFRPHRTHLPHPYHPLRRLRLPLRRHDEHAPSSPALRTLTENATMVAHS